MTARRRWDRRMAPREDAVYTCDVALSREACLPHALLDCLVPQAAEAGAQRILDEETRLLERGRPLADALYAVVPRVEGGIRRQVLALRRALHAGRPSTLTDIELTAIADASGVDADTLRRWCADASTLTARCVSARNEYGKDAGRSLRDTLHGALASPAFVRALSLTSPGFFSQLRDIDGTTRKARHARRKLLNYVIRGAAKTVPLSQFATLGLLGQSDPQSWHDPVSDVRPSQELIFARAEQIAHEDRLFRLNSTLRWSGDVCTFIGNRAFHRSTPRRLAILRHRFDPSVAAVVRTLPSGVGIRGSDVLARLEAAGCGTDDARATVRVLLVTGVLRREAAPDGYARNGRELAAQVRASGLEPLAAVVDGLYEEGCARGFATAAPAERRQTVTRLLRASVAGGADASSEAAGNAYDERNLVFETLWGRPALSPRHLDALRWRLLPALADGLRGTIRVSTAYRTLLGHFIRNFGKGGVCPNLLDWLVRVAELSPGGFGFEEDAEVRASLSLTVYLTMVDGRPGDTASGSLHAACQTIHPWGLWQTGRFTYGCSRPARLLRRRLRRYLYRTRHPREPVSFLPDADIMNLQANSPLTRRVLDWPTQSRHAGTAFVDPSTISVRHCVETNTFGLFDAAGAEIALVYGGGLVPSPTMTAGSLMVALANPFEVPPLAPVLAAPGKPEVVAVPRKYLGDLVVARAYWWVPSPVLREAAEASGFDRYLALRRIWRRLQLPDRSFISGFTSGRQSGSFWDAPPRVSRSSWFDARVESCLEELPAVLSHDWVILQEAFPSGSEIVSWRQTEVRANSVCAEAFLPRVTASLHGNRVAAGVVRSAP